MLSQELRPFDFNEMAGQEENKRILSAIIRDPEKAPKCLIFAGAFGSGKCLIKGSRVNTSEGYVKIEDLIENHVFDSEGFMDISDRHITTLGGEEISHLYYGGEQDLIHIHSSRFDISGTYNHKVLSVGDKGLCWKKLSELNVGDVVAMDLTGSDNFLVNNKSDDIPYFKYNDSEFEKGYLLGAILGDDHSVTEEISGWLKSHGISKSFSKDRIIPEWFFRTNKDFLSGVLTGLYDSNDSIAVNFHVLPNGLARGYRDILSMFGIISTLEDVKVDEGNGIKPNRCGVMVHSDRDCKKLSKILNSKNPIKRKYLHNLTNSGILSSGSDEYEFVKIESIDYTRGEVYDITVPTTHAFMANGVINNNTTSARILAREINHVKDKNFDLLNSKFYYEYDSTVIGNVETIRNLRDQFTISYGDYYRIIVLDETHAVSTQAQNALLKVLEEAQGKTFFILCTTEPNKLLPTIRSRSLELEFKKVPRDEIIKNLAQVEQRMNITFSDEIKGLIADRSDGHMRNAHMLIDKYLLLGEKDFVDSISSSIKWFCTFFIAIQQKKPNYVTASINMLMNIPMEELHSDWNTIMVESMKAFNGLPVSHESIAQLVKELGKDNFRYIIDIYFSQWVRRMFEDMPYFQASMLNIYDILSRKMGSEPSNTTQETQVQVRSDNPYANSRARKR